MLINGAFSCIANNQQLSKKWAHMLVEEIQGSYKNGLKHGHGAWTHPDGDKYRGKFKSGLKRGNGVYTFKNGEEYRGHLKEISSMGLDNTNTIMAKSLKESSKTIYEMARVSLFFVGILSNQEFGKMINS